MSIKIDNKALEPRNSYNRNDWVEYLLALSALKVGQSFLFANPQSNHRLAIGILQHTQEKTFSMRKEINGKYRIGRTA